MSELRRDPIVGRWVIIAERRAERPVAIMDEEERDVGPSACPLCPGKERNTPPEVFAIRPDCSEPNTPGWLIRVVPNKYPALTIEGDLNRRGLGMFDLMNGVGAHEVIIETPEHNARLPDLPLQQIKLVLVAYRERIIDLRNDKRFIYILVFRNYRAAAGASLLHPHSQLIAIAITPEIVKRKLESARAHFMEKQRCLFCDLLSQELRLGERVVLETEHFVVLSPFAARFPYELHIYPKAHCHDFVLMNEEQLEDFARTLKRILCCVRDTLNDPPYNYVLHTSPNPVPRLGRPDYWQTLPYDYHWHLEFIPRLTRVAGFEWGTGFYINPVPPELAAEVLRGELSSKGA
ncbi:MAG: galactose-1-phosphate uridylyltransferase [Armatimonadota bacterium]|nr:galactose-1-phosphate uridylyltransferase [Armatimonadota bacterium]MCX7777292.1 galactose-1-phosphate uridylyltransferase [Armatimonadota bacterium]MDW8024391.1 galactose-1-phosphate uridylyltransferase [Armatimonadota bacterium]